MADLQIPTGALPLSNSSGNVANATANAVLVAPSNNPNATNYVTSFSISGAGATAASVVTATLTGVVGGPLNYTVAVPAGATLGLTPILRQYAVPLAGIPGQAITLSLPALGAGNTNAAVNITGFRL
jgi:hypothetical protein